jgi:hypothetical protein
MNVFDPCTAWPYDPTVETMSATDVNDESGGGASATFNGQVNPNGTAVAAWFEYWPAGQPGAALTTAPQNIDAGHSTYTVSTAVTNLEADTSYMYKLVVNNGVEDYDGHAVAINTNILYVSKATGCHEYSPCYTYIQQAIEALDGTVGLIKVESGIYFEDWTAAFHDNVFLSENAELCLGFNSAFTARSSSPTTINPGDAQMATLTIDEGAVTPFNLILQ